MKKPKSASPSPDLPPTIWAEIFHKLPLISVGRCLRVCKQWCRLISDPLFLSNYNPNSIRNHPISLFMEWENELILVNEAFKKKGLKSKSLERRPFRSRGDFFVDGQERKVKVLGSCNGLVALHKSLLDFVLFNPCTKDEKRVRLDANVIRNNFFSVYRLYGLCHDPARDEYKVVICDFRCFFVLSLKDGSFSKFNAQSQLLQSLKWWTTTKRGRPTMVGGVPHWAVKLVEDGGADVIMYFDPLAEELQMVRFPKPKLKTTWASDGFALGALDGQPTLTLDIGKGYEVWALKEYRNEPCWTMLFVFPRACDTYKILARVSDDEILVFRHFFKVYNIKTRRSRLLLLSNRKHLITSYIPSLVSPNH